MAYFAWVGQEQTLSPAALTTRVQTINPLDLPDRILWDAFMPRINAPSVKLRTITNLDFRPVSDRREWNTRGRLIPLKTPKIDELEGVPIEAYFRLGEREIQDLEERTNGNQTVFRDIIGVDIPSRTDGLAMANIRRLELDVMRAWANGTLVARNPQTNVTSTFSYGFAAGRYQTAGTAWSTVANAYDEFVAWIETGIQQVGSAVGAYMRNATFKAIQADAPQGAALVRLTRPQVEARISDDLGIDFRFYIDERTASPFTDAGLDTASEYVWPTGKVALVPAGERVGNVHFAPVARAYEIARAVPAASIDVRGQTVYYEVGNNGRELTVECQFNPIPIPDENRLWVIDAGV